LVGLLVLVSSGSVAWAQPAAPQAYTVEAEGAFVDRKMTLTIVRDGPRERVELAIERAGVMTTLYDFEAHRVYWIGWSGAGTCSSGRYPSTRARVDEDPVTGTADRLAKLTEGRSRKPAGTGTVAGRPARIEAFVGGTRPKDPDEPWPTRVWLAEEGGHLLKLEGTGAKGQPVTLLEVKRLTFGKPVGAVLQPPAGCIATDSEMSETGDIRGHAEASTEVRASASADLASGATSATVTRTEGTGSKPGALAKLATPTLSAIEQPDTGPCGAKLQLTATITVDGPATVTYKFQPSVGGLQFTGGQAGTVTMAAAGDSTLVTDAIFPRSLKGQLKLQAMVMGEKGHNGPMKTSAPVPFQLTCGGK
jgi:hypothetical protein